MNEVCGAKNISATTVTYFSELTLLRSLMISMVAAAEKLNKELGYTFTYFIVDNSCNEDYFWKLEMLFSEIEDSDIISIHLLRSPENGGFSSGNNYILDKLVSQYHLVVNPDVTVSDASLINAVQYLNCHADAVLLSPQITNGVGVKHTIKRYPDALTLLLRYLDSKFLNRYFARRLNEYQYADLGQVAVGNVSLAGGCFQLVRTDIFKLLGGFSENFFMYFEDYDLSIRLKKYGKIAYVPSVTITHMGGYVGRKSIKHHVYFIISALKFAKIHGWKLW